MANNNFDKIFVVMYTIIIFPVAFISQFILNLFADKGKGTRLI